MIAERAHPQEIERDPRKQAQSEAPAMIARAWIEKPEFVAQVGAALAAGAGYAAGKIGFSEQNWLYHPIFRAEQPGLRQRRS